ncbi:MAG: Unknown protein [uncultured Sulfurovum sp.]|uniref:Uncharacterized protein n=1 Tax=uncultured Sulfurovum sp. TaxID=269237 RepID=A0A6S6SK95_9BACT|nr:MAG: Unknown protein [uncultured Sulfurovum sp.]
MTNIEKINSLLDKLEEKLGSSSSLREENLKHIGQLVKTLHLDKKHSNFDTIFNYKAMNLAGIGLKNEDFGEIREGKYVQIIAIASEINEEGQKIIKNLSLGYYGKAERLKEKDKQNIIEFVLRWRYEKTFRHSDYYQRLLATIT